MRTLGIDLGTSGVRAVVLDGDAVTEARAVPDDRRDPASLWGAVRLALAALDLTRVTALAVAGTSGSVLAADRSGAPLGRLLLYSDPGTGCFAAAPTVARVLVLQDTYGVQTVLHEADWIAGRFSGCFEVTDETNALKTGYDAASRRWPDWMDGTGLRAELLPRVVPAGTPLGPVTTAARAAFGLPADAIVVAGTTDGCASFLSAGAGEPGDAVTSLGSTLTLKLFSDVPVTDAASGVYSHVLRGLWLPGGASNAGGAVLANFFAPATIAALSERIDASRDSGLDLYPLLSPGERFPVADPAFAPRMTRPSDDVAFLHGMLEGLARIEARGYARLAELGAPAVGRVISVGGGAANAAWTAIRARVMGVPVSAAPGASAAHGAAILARSAHGDAIQARGRQTTTRR